jgi:hypothetical protein
MKKVKKHNFSHIDPESTRNTNTKEEVTGDVKSQKITAPTDNLAFIKKDLLKSIVLISIFLLLLVVLYLVQTRTELFRPVLKLFGI